MYRRLIVKITCLLYHTLNSCRDDTDGLNSMSKERKVKIFITYKDKHRIISSDIIKPIQTGRVLSEENFEGMIGDDTGDSISILNPYFCELSAVYWIWKHYEEIGNPEYIGFMHYRRHFLFGNKDYKPDYFGLVKFDDVDEDYLKNDLTDDDNIEKIVTGYDAIFPQKIDIKTDKCKTNYEQFKQNHIISDYDSAISILKDKYPEYYEYAQMYNKSSLAYFLDMFIMKKELFFRYCSWIFDILFELKNVISFDRDSTENRALGYVAERLTGIFLTKLASENLSVKEVPVSFIANELNYAEEKIEDEIPVVISSSDFYVPYTSVMLQSLKEHVCEDNKYRIVIMTQDMSVENKRILKKQIETNNIKIKFINLKNKLKQFKNRKIKLEHVGVETYSRLFIPELLYNYDKCVYLDGDIICLDDIKKLYDIDLEGKSIGASVCAVMNAWYNEEEEYKDYIDNILGLKDSASYFQAGIVIMDLKKMREENALKALCEHAKNKKNLYYADQCLMNYYFKNDVKYIDMAWNYEFYHEGMKAGYNINKMSVDVLQNYLRAMNNPKIIHYQGERKPWYFPIENCGRIWWDYAKKTPYYEEHLKRMAEYSYNLLSYSIITTVRDVKHWHNVIFKYWKYKLLSSISFGKRKEHYKKKRSLFKNKIINAKKIVK